MALKDSIRHFKDVDGYSEVIKKEDMDDNFDLLADNIDNEVTRATDKENDLQTDIDDEVTRAKNVEGDITTLQTANQDNLTSAINEIVDEINIPFTNDDLNSFSDVFSAGIKTADDTQTDVSNINLTLKSINTITIIGSILQDDYTTKWSFERVLSVAVKDDGSVTIATDDNTDIVKDDSDWVFDVTSTDDSDNPYLTMKATGKADTNIIWGVEVKNKFTNWK